MVKLWIHLLRSLNNWKALGCMVGANVSPRVSRVVSCGVSVCEDKLKIFTISRVFWCMGLGLGLPSACFLLAGH